MASRRSAAGWACARALRQRRSSVHVSYGVVFTALAVITYALWIPFGWKVVGTFEEWGIMEAVDERGLLGVLYTASSHRPLYMAPWALAEWLTPGSFFGLNVIQALLLFGKSTALFWLMARLWPEREAVAFAAAALLLVYPADQAVYTLRTTNLHAGVFFMLVAWCLLLAAAERPTWPRVAAMATTEALSLATYDGGLLLMLCGPGLLLLQRRVTGRRAAALAGAWSIVPLLFFVQLLHAIRNPASYQTQLIRLSGLGGDYGEILRTWLASIQRALTRTFWEGWKEAFTLARGNDLYLHIAIALTLLVVLPVTVWLSFGQRPSSDDRMQRSKWVVVALGVAAVIAGFAMYLPTTWRNTNWRVLVYSSVGASVAVAAVCWAIAALFGKWSSMLFAAIASVLFLAGADYALDQHGYYYAYGQRQQRVLSEFVKAAPHLTGPGPVDILLIDTTPTAVFDAWMMCTTISDCLNVQLRYLYQTPALRAAYCAPGFRPRGEHSEQCQFGPQGVTVSYSHLESHEPVELFFPYNALVAFENTTQGIRLLRDIDAYRSHGGFAYAPGIHVDVNGLPPARVHTMFTRWPFRVSDPRKKMSTSFAFEFDRLVPGYGWSGPEGSFTWTNAVQSTIDAWLQPGADYIVRFRILRGITSDVLASVRLDVNGTVIPLTASTPDPEGATIFCGTIPSAAVDADREETVLKFRVNRVVTPKSLGINDDERTLGLRFDWIRIRHDGPSCAATIAGA